MSNKTTKKILIALIILILIFVVFFIFKDRAGKNNKSNLNLDESSQKEIISYSRINFFLTSPNKASLSIPDYWEGNYRIKEEGSEAIFYYLDKKRNTTELFRITYVKKDSEFFYDSTELITENDDYNFYLIKNDNTYLDEDLYHKMIDSINDTIKSFKVS